MLHYMQAHWIHIARDIYIAYTNKTQANTRSQQTQTTNLFVDFSVENEILKASWVIFQ